jgi:hypothetical protein
VHQAKQRDLGRERPGRAVVRNCGRNAIGVPHLARRI